MLDMLYQRDCIIFSFEKFLQTISSPSCIHMLLDIVLYELKILIGLNLFLPMYTNVSHSVQYTTRCPNT